MKRHYFSHPKETLRRVRVIGSVLTDGNYSSVTLGRYLELEANLERKYGRKQATKLLKEYYNSLKFRSLGCKSEQPSIWEKTTYMGLPKSVAKVLYPYNPDSTSHVRWALTLFSLVEERMDVVVQADIATLEKEISQEWPAEVKERFARYLKTSKWIRHLPKRTSTKEYPLQDKLSLKGSPYGAPAIFKSPIDAKTLLDRPEDFSKIKALESTYICKCDNLDSGMPTLLAKPVESYPRGVCRTLQTIGIPDKSGKVRTITLGNYFLQRSLRPIHDRMMDTLKTIPQDGTYYQDKAAQTVKEWTLQGYQPWCFDLTQATDRFPVAIQLLVVKELFPEHGDQWGNLMVGCKSYSPDLDREFTFSVGQPMGLYSSWAAFTLTHHAIIRYCFRECGRSPSNAYYIIGDDVAILHEDVARLYEQLILSLGVSISQSKSITPLTRVNGQPSAEIAKRYFRGGVEISPVRPFMLKALSGRGWVLIRELYSQIKQRWTQEEVNKLFASTNPGDDIPLLRLVDTNKRSRAVLILTSPNPQELVPGSGSRPGDWYNQFPEGRLPRLWPTDKLDVLRTAWLSVGWDKLTELVNKLHGVQTSLADQAASLQLADFSRLKEDIKISPVWKVFNLIDSDVKDIYRRMHEDFASTSDVYDLGLNLDLFQALLDNPEAIRDYKSLKFKRVEALAAFTLDLWKALLFDYNIVIKEKHYRPREPENDYSDWY